VLTRTSECGSEVSSTPAEAIKIGAVRLHRPSRADTMTQPTMRACTIDPPAFTEPPALSSWVGLGTRRLAGIDLRRVGSGYVKESRHSCCVCRAHLDCRVCISRE
jgi:hypothetical protein